MDVFTALLTNAGAKTGEGTEITQASTATLGLNGAARNLIATLVSDTAIAAGQAEGEDAVPPQGEGEEGALTGLADLLLRVEAALDAGEAVDPELLKKLEAATDALAALIGGQGQIVGAPSPHGDGLEGAAAANAGAPATEPDAAGDPVHPMLQSLADKLKALGERLNGADGDLAAKLAALSEKLGTVRTTIADLIKEAPELKTLIGNLMQLKVEAKTAATVATPALAAPELRLPENASLSAKTVSGTTPEPAAAPGEDAPSDGDAVEAPKVQIKAEVAAKPDQPVTALADKREAPGQALPQPPPAAADAAGTVVTTQAAETGTLRAVQTAYQTPSPINLPHMAFEIARHVQQGVSKFQIRLDPPELGRIDVKLDMDHSGQVNAKLTVERSETLDLLQRDQRALERALAQAGLDSSKTNLEFTLKQNPFAGQDGKGQHTEGSPFGGDARTPVVAEADPAPAVSLYRGTASPGGVNIFV